MSMIRNEDGSLIDHRIECKTAGKTKQSMRDECDVNFIMARYVKTGLIEHLSGGIPSFPDVSELGDYRSAIENMRSADKYFQGLPAEVRARFGHDAANFMEFLQSGASEEDLRKLSLEILGDRRTAREPVGREGDVVEPPAGASIDAPLPAAGTVPT